MRSSRCPSPSVQHVCGLEHIKTALGMRTLMWMHRRRMRTRQTSHWMTRRHNRLCRRHRRQQTLLPWRCAGHYAQLSIFHRSKQVGLVAAADEPCCLLSRGCNKSAIAQHCESRRRRGVRSRTRRTRRFSGSCEPASRRWRWTPAARARRRCRTGRCRRRRALRRARRCHRWGRSRPSSG